MKTRDTLAIAAHFRNISELARLIDGSQDADESYRLLTQGVCEHSHWDISSIQVLDLDAGLAIPIVRHDPINGHSLKNIIGWDARSSPVGRVLKNGAPLIIEDAAEQDLYPGFRDDARKRKYHTTAMIPLGVHDAEGRPMVYSVASRAVLDLDEVEVEFLNCVADLATIAIRKLRRLETERMRAGRMRKILENMTASLSHALDSDAVSTLASGFSSLFPAGWLAVDLTSGRALYDPSTPPPISIETSRRLPDEVIFAALNARGQRSEVQCVLTVDGVESHPQVSALEIDNTHVGALFFFDVETLEDDEQIASQAGRLALSAFILRSFSEFRSRRVTARKLITRLLDGDLRDPDQILDDAYQLGLDLKGECRLLIIQPEAHIDDSAHSFLQRSVQAVFGQTISCQLDGRLVFLLVEGGKDRRTQQAQFLARTRVLLPASTSLVLSETQTRFDSLTKAFQTCLNTLKVGQAMGATGWVTPVNIGEFSSLMAAVDTRQLSAFLDKALPETLHDQSRKSATAIETIEAFLRTGRRHGEASEKLGIHVSTLRYRLEQLSDLYGFNFSDSERCFELELAIRLMKLRNSYET